MIIGINLQLNFKQFSEFLIEKNENLKEDDIKVEE